MGRCGEGHDGKVWWGAWWEGVVRGMMGRCGEGHDGKVW